MKRFNLIILLLLISLNQVQAHETDRYKVFFLAETDSEEIIREVVNDIGSLLLDQPETDRAASHMAMFITPRLREQRLSKFNLRKLEKVQKIKKKSWSDEKKEKELSESQYQLIKSPFWDSGNDVLGIVLRLDTSTFNNLYRDYLAKDITLLTKEGAKVCNEKIGDEIYLSEDDKQYLNQVYNIDLHDNDWEVYIERFNPECFKEHPSKVTFEFRRPSGLKPNRLRASAFIGKSFWPFSRSIPETVNKDFE